MNDKKILEKINRPKRRVETIAVTIIFVIVVASIFFNYLFLH